MLGLSREATSDAVNRQYKKKIADAHGNDAEKAKIESAHSTIMMSQLSARMKACTPSLRGTPSYCVSSALADEIHEASSVLRLEQAVASRMCAYSLVIFMQGGVEVAKDIRFADKAVYFPWRPR